MTSNYRDTGPVTDFEPWAGIVSYNAASDWSNIARIGNVAVHEIGHVLGIGTAAIFDSFVSGSVFTGVNTTQLNQGAGLPLHSDLSHVEEGFAGDTVVLDPTSTRADVVVPSQFDAAILSDIGYEIDGFAKQGSQPEISTNQGELIFGSPFTDVLNGLGGDDTLSGIDGDDVLIGGPGKDSLFGGDGSDAYIVGTGHGENNLWDFNPSSEMLYIVGSNFASASDAIASATNPFSNSTRITLQDSTQINVSVFAGQLNTQNVTLLSKNGIAVSTTCKLGIRTTTSLPIP